MWGGLEIFVVAGWLTITPIAEMQVKYPADSLYNWNDTTSVVLIEFDSNMDTDGLRDTANYKLITTSDSKQYKIYKIGIVNYIDSITIRDTSLVALITERLPYRKEFTVTVQGVKNKKGIFIGGHNIDWFFFDGYVPNKIRSPQVEGLSK